jgi:hypothetical protein
VAIAAGAYFYMQSTQRPAPAAPAPIAKSGPVANPTAPPPTAAPAQEAPPSEAAKPAAAAEPAAPAQSVELSVTSEPRGAQVLADGKPAGTTPATLSLSAGAPVEISVHSPGYTTATQRVTPQAGMPPQSFVLTPLPYELVITTDPSGGKVRVKELSALSPAPLALGHLDGMVTALVEKDGYQRMSRIVRLEEFHEQGGTMRAEVAVSLSPLPGAARHRPPAHVPTAPPEPPGSAANPPPPPVVQLKPEPGADEPAADKKPSPAPEPAVEAAPPPSKPEVVVAPPPVAEAPAPPPP